MAILKCKMCGGDIILSEDKTFGTCDSCGSTMTFPKVSDEHKLNLYNRANHFRRQNEFDKAIAAYDKILDQDNTDAEAHWGAVLSRYGIEYVEDPATHERIPTCHRVQAASILSDPDYLSALEYAPDTASRDIYEQEARRIAEIQKGILSISSQEKPYDVFICYKETDDFGSRTKDSTLAQEIYYQLTNEGYKVFFSRITLEDKLGQQYEPYIFAALNSAKVMLVVGTKPEYFSAVWVKNEWSRYLALMKNDRSRLLIPCYRDMDPYDLPEELSALQSQDMSKIGFVQDLIRGIKKITAKDESKTKTAPQIVTAAGANIENLMKRAWLFMEDGDFKSANEYLDKVLDENAEYAPAYIGKVCTALKLHKEADLAETTFLYEDNTDWKKALRFADAKQKEVYAGYINQVKTRIEKQIRDRAYDCAMEMATNPRANRASLDAECRTYTESCHYSTTGRADGSRRQKGLENENAFLKAVQTNEPGDVTEQGYQTAADMFRTIGDQEAKERAESCLILAEQARQKVIYQQAESIARKSTSARDYDQLAEMFLSIQDYKDAQKRAEDCRRTSESIRRNKYVAAVNTIKDAGNVSRHWKYAQEQLNHKDLDGYRDVENLREQASQKYEQCLQSEREAIQRAEESRRKAEEEAKRRAEEAKQKEEERRAQEAARIAAKKKRNTLLAILAVIMAITVFFVITKIIMPKVHYDKGMSLRSAGQWDEAVNEFEQAGDYSDAATQIQETYYQHAALLNDAGKYEEAYNIYMMISGYSNVDFIIENNKYIAWEAKLKLLRTVGNYVAFGSYEQDNNNSNGKEAIEWLVLDVQDNKALLISRYGLDSQLYNSSNANVTWETCTLRTWLNSVFLNSAFSTDEQKAILTTEVDNSEVQGNSKWNTNGGNNTQDKLFLLSYAEANSLFSNDDARMCAPTAYAIEQGAFAAAYSYKVNGMASGWWWLRSPGPSSSPFTYVLAGGEFGIINQQIINANYNCAVRPAFWIDLEADAF